MAGHASRGSQLRFRRTQKTLRLGEAFPAGRRPDGGPAEDGIRGGGGPAAPRRIPPRPLLLDPNLFPSLCADRAAAFLLWPQAPDRTRVVVDSLFHPDEIVKPTFDPSDAVDFRDLINRKDWSVCERAQQGMGSRAFDRGNCAPMENLSLDIRRCLAERIGLGRINARGPRPRASPRRWTSRAIRWTPRTR